MRKLVNLLILPILFGFSKPRIFDAINSASETVRVSYSTLCKIAWIESRWEPRASNPYSSARGLFQITKGTERILRRKYDISGNIYDPYVNSLLGAYHTEETVRYYKSKDIKASPVNLYIGHFFGASSAVKFINTDGTIKAKEAFPKEYKYNKKLFGNKTINELKLYFKKQMNGARSCG